MRKSITIGDVYSFLGQTLAIVISTDLVRKSEDQAYGKAELSAVGNLRDGVKKYVVTYNRSDSNEFPVVRWREEFTDMTKAIAFYNQLMNGELSDDRY